MFGTRDTAVVQRGVGMLMVRTLKTMWAFDPGKAAPRDWTLYHIVAIFIFYLLYS